MIAGFVDARGRAYDVGFRTLRLFLTDEEGILATSAGEQIAVQEEATVSISLLERKPVPFLMPVRGEVISTGVRIVFLGAPGLARTAPFTFFNVSLPLHPSAIEHFFTVQGGREFAQFEKSDVESSSSLGTAMEATLRGPRPGKAEEWAHYLLRIEPRSVGERALATLR